MNLNDYKPTCALDFEILLDKWVDSQRNIMPTGKYNKEEHLKEMLLEAFTIGFKAGQMPVNRPITLLGNAK